MSSEPTEPVSLLLVTGAGASHNFGTGGNQIPLMNEWSNALINKLKQKNNSYAEAVGLTLGLEGTEFEKRLGEFLHAVEAFPQIQQIVGPSVNFQAVDGLQPGSQLSGWFTSTEYHLGQINFAIQDSLIELFGYNQFNLSAATIAYSELFKQLKLGTDQSLVLATTNYDVAGDNALQKFGFRVDNGEQQPVVSPGEATLDVEGIIDGLPRRTPVLHLHGKIGWYDRGSELVALPTHYSMGNSDGVPILMLPDTNKKYGSNSVINSLWRQFEKVVPLASRILVLGHSLNDPELVRVLKEGARKPAVIAVTYFQGNSDGESDRKRAETEVERIASTFPGSTIIPIDFRSGGFDISNSIEGWFKNINAK